MLRNFFCKVQWRGWQIKSGEQEIEKKIIKLSPSWVQENIEMIKEDIRENDINKLNREIEMVELDKALKDSLKKNRLRE